MASLEEVNARAPSWSLEGDVKLLQHLRDLSSNIITRTRDVADAVEDLEAASAKADVDLHSTVNEFMMLANKQFFENRVYDDDDTVDDEEAGMEASRTSMRPETVRDLSGQLSLSDEYKEAVALGLESLKFFVSHTPAQSSAQAPQDIYNSRPLPFIIGSQAFLESDDVGLSAYDEVEEREPVPTENGGSYMHEGGEAVVPPPSGLRLPPPPAHLLVHADGAGDGTGSVEYIPPLLSKPQSQMGGGGGLFDDDGAEDSSDDVFDTGSGPSRPSGLMSGGGEGGGSENGVEGGPMGGGLSGMDAIKAAIAARASMMGGGAPPGVVPPSAMHQPGVPSSPAPSLSSLPQRPSPQPAQPPPKEEELEDDNLFDDGDDPYSLFGGAKAKPASSLTTPRFSTTDQFADLFGKPAATPQATSAPSPTPSGQAKTTKTAASLLFADDDDDDDDALFAGLKTNPILPPTTNGASKVGPASAPSPVPASIVKKSSSLFDDDDDPFAPPRSSDRKPPLPPTTPASSLSAAGPSAPTNQRSASKGLFDDDEDDSLFGAHSRPAPSPSPAVPTASSTAAKPISTLSPARASPPVEQKPSGLFADGDEDAGLFGVVSKPQEATKPPLAKSLVPLPFAKTKIKKGLFDDDDDDEGGALFGGAKAPVPVLPAGAAKAGHKARRNLFDDDDDDDEEGALFGGGKAAAGQSSSSVATSGGSSVPLPVSSTPSSQPLAATSSSTPKPPSKASSLFADEEDPFGVVKASPPKAAQELSEEPPAVSAPPPPSVAKKSSSSLFDDDDDGPFALPSTKPSAPASAPPVSKPSSSSCLCDYEEPPAQAASPLKAPSPPSPAPAVPSDVKAPTEPVAVASGGKVAGLAATLGIDPTKGLPGAFPLKLPPRPPSDHDDESGSEWTDDEASPAKSKPASSVFAPTAISKIMQTAVPKPDPLADVGTTESTATSLTPVPTAPASGLFDPGPASFAAPVPSSPVSKASPPPALAPPTTTTALFTDDPDDDDPFAMPSIRSTSAFSTTLPAFKPPASTPAAPPIVPKPASPPPPPAPATLFDDSPFAAPASPPKTTHPQPGLPPSPPRAPVSSGSGKVSSLASSLMLDPTRMLPGAVPFARPPETAFTSPIEAPGDPGVSLSYSSSFSASSSLDSSKNSSALNITAALDRVSGPPRRSRKAPSALLSADLPKEPQAVLPQSPAPTSLSTAAPSPSAGVVEGPSAPSSHFGGSGDDLFGDSPFSMPSGRTVPPSASQEPFRSSPEKPAPTTSSSVASLFGVDEDIFGLSSASAKAPAPPSLPPVPSPPLFGDKSGTPVPSVKQPSPRPSKAASLFADDDTEADLFGGGGTKEAKAPTTTGLPPKPAFRGLFGDDDADDVFSPKKGTASSGGAKSVVKKASLFDDDDDGSDPFASLTAKKSVTGSRKSLFDDDDPLFK